jgi:hypothetical protein
MCARAVARSPSSAALRRPRGGFHRLYLGQLPAFASVGDRQPRHLDPPPRSHCPPFRCRQPVPHQGVEHRVREAMRQHDRLGGPVWGSGEQAQRPALIGRETALWAHRHCTPVSVSRAGCSSQFGRASAPMIPHRVHTMRGPNDGTGTWSGHGSAPQDRPMVALPPRHFERPHAVGAHVAQCHRVAGWGSGSCWGRVLMPVRITWPLSAKAAVTADIIWCLFLTHCGHAAKKDGATQQCVVESRNGGVVGQFEIWRA